ncbi:uncharacterized protein LOC122274419 [Carya illinoinensis]|uniref:uncharacterized protein LOC122274419 n=1 Tax=Carya illinoinensis TaxID=32201 RepID=UPI001C71FB87|nr:uncharacterized protein LOC122274419 [Carya illinoinensis]
MDNVMVAFETLHSMKRKGKGQQGYMAVKLDMSKQLNKAKTSIFFSSNTKKATKDYILTLAGTCSTSSYEKYLGLPTLIGRSRHAAFKGILDRMRSRISNWKTKFLSQAGKEILLKAVIQALPTYCMGVFKLPKSLLNEFNRVMHHFWWGHMNQEKKVHWVSWNQMGKAKGAGGLGFRDFESFNLSLLAKQGWRLIQYPNSLAATVFKTKYYSKSDFFQAKIGARPSFIWRSLCAARGLLEKGSIWRIGNGQDAKIWNCRWLPRPTSFMVQSPVQGLSAEARVTELIDGDTKQWNSALVHGTLGPEIAEIVLKIPISVTGARDKLIWTETKDGEEESTTHALWSCPSAMDVWNQGPTVFQKSSNNAGDFKSLVEKSSASSYQDSLELFSVTAKGIWQRRNRMLFENAFTYPSQVARQAVDLLESFKAAQAQPKNRTQHSQDLFSIWMPPPMNTIKINWDAALSVAKNRTGFGLVARNHQGSIVSTKKLSSGGVLEPLLAEALGGLHAVTWAKEEVGNQLWWKVTLRL